MNGLKHSPAIGEFAVEELARRKQSEARLHRKSLSLLKEWQAALGQGDRPDLDAHIKQLKERLT